MRRPASCAPPTAVSPPRSRDTHAPRTVDGRRARQEAALSRSTFFERFSRAVGVAPMEYLLTWRMALAENLLRRNEGRIAEIAGRVGCSSASTFSVAFTRHVGRPPAQYARDDRRRQRSMMRTRPLPRDLRTLFVTQRRSATHPMTTPAKHRHNRPLAHRAARCGRHRKPACAFQRPCLRCARHDDMLVGFTEQGVQQFQCHRSVHERAGPRDPDRAGRIARRPCARSRRLHLRDAVPAAWVERAARRLDLPGLGGVEASFGHTLVDDRGLVDAICQAFLAIHGNEASSRARRDRLLIRLGGELRGPLVLESAVVPPAIARVRDLLHEHGRQHQLDELAHAAGIDRFRLTRLFQRAFGTSPHSACACGCCRAGCWRPAARPRRRPRTSASPTRAIWAAGSAARTGSRRPLTGNSAQTFQTDRARQPIMSVSTRLMFDTKVALIVRDDLAAWQKLNVVAFLATASPKRPKRSASLTRMRRDAADAMLGQPMLVFSADLNGLQAAHRRALSRELTIVPYVHAMFRPGTTRPTATCFGPAMRRISTSSGWRCAAEEAVDKAVKGLALHA